MSDLSYGQQHQNTSSSSSIPSSSSAAHMNGKASKGSPLATSASSHLSSSGRFCLQEGDPAAVRPAGLGEAQHEATVRKHKSRHSGGFLLESATSAFTRSESKRHTIHGLPTGKGKGREDDVGFVSRKYTVRPSAHRHKPSIGSSPLSTKVTNAAQNEHHDLDGASSLSHEPSKVSSTPANGGLSDKMTKEIGEPRPVSQQTDLDMNPAQIVNLALNLSESRRRHVSGGRLSPIDPLGNRRIVSASQVVPGRSTAPTKDNLGASLRHHIQQQRRTSRNMSPKSIKMDLDGGPQIRPMSSQSINREPEPPALPGFGAGFVDDYMFSPSDATLLRAEKARISLELCYEYRRLLPHLEPLPTPHDSRPGTSRSAKKSKSDPSQAPGRLYNPLQYIRNRKIRNRERKTFDAEADGWKNLERVRSWVNSVSSLRQDRVLNATSELSLPPFLPEQNLLREEPSPTSSLQRFDAPTAVKVSRPKTEWITTPWDFLADAYWLDQDEHRKLIEDRDGHKLFPTATSQIESASRTSLDVIRPSARRSSSIPRSGQVSKTKDISTIKPQDWPQQERGRRRHQFRDSITSLHEYSSSQDRKSRWHRKVVRAQSSSSSDESPSGNLNRLSQQDDLRDSRERQDSAILDRQMLRLLAKEAVDSAPGTIRQREKPIEFSSQLGENGNRLHQSDTNHSATAGEATEKSPYSHEKVHNLQPRSPTEKGTVPNMAMKFSREEDGIGAPRKQIPTLQRMAQADQENESSRPNSNAGMTGSGPIIFTSEANSRLDGIEYIPRPDTSSTPADGLLSPKSAEGFRSLRRKRSNSKSLRGQKEQGDMESRLRGMLRGPSRLAEMVGSPVSKVGDLLWRRDVSSRISNIASPASSNASEASDTDGDTSLTKSKRHRAPKKYDEEEYPKNITNEDSPKYHLNNLPTFRSTFLKDSNDNKPVTANGNDHIARQQIASRERSRSSRFSRLAPPGLDLRSISPSPSATLTRIETTDSDMTRDELTQSSGRQSVGRPNLRQMSSTFGPNLKLPVTGLTRLDIQRRISRPNLQGKRHWSISDRGVPSVRGIITIHDITRVRALLLSSGVKANEISRRAVEIPDLPSEILQEIQRSSTAPLPRVPRSREHALASRLLVQSIDDTNRRLREAADHMSDTTINELHKRITTLDARITSTLTPMVRASADDADLLSNELSTTHRLSIKQLNDSLDLIVRRRRRRFRWMRRGGYLLLEWTLLGLMWWVWLIVVIIRLIRGTVSGLFAGIKWFLWL